jgi:hypothetical protein
MDFRYVIGAVVQLWWYSIQQRISHRSLDKTGHGIVSWYNICSKEGRACVANRDIRRAGERLTIVVVTAVRQAVDVVRGEVEERPEQAVRCHAAERADAKAAVYAREARQNRLRVRGVGACARSSYR